MLKSALTTKQFFKKFGEGFGVHGNFYNLDWNPDWASDNKELKKIFTSKRFQKHIDNTTYKNINAVIFGDHIRFLTKSNYPGDFGTYFACYISSEDTLYVFNNHIVSLLYHQELYGLTKEDIIKNLEG